MTRRKGHVQRRCRGAMGAALLGLLLPGCAVYGAELIPDDPRTQVGGESPTSDEVVRVNDAGDEASTDVAPPGIAGDAASSGPESRPPACSLHGGYRIKLTIENTNLTRALSARWIDWSCIEHVQGRVAPATAMHVTSYVGHVWRIRDDATSVVLKEIPGLTGDTVITLP